MDSIEMVLQTKRKRDKQMSTQEEQALALKTLHEAIQALKDCGLMIEEEEE
jgi:biotin operon repressor